MGATAQDALASFRTCWKPVAGIKKYNNTPDGCDESAVLPIVVMTAPDQDLRSTADRAVATAFG
jgi:hypothetical protein